MGNCWTWTTANWGRCSQQRFTVTGRSWYPGIENPIFVCLSEFPALQVGFCPLAAVTWGANLSGSHPPHDCRWNTRRILLSMGEGNITLKTKVNVTCISLFRSGSSAHSGCKGSCWKGCPRKGTATAKAWSGPITTHLLGLGIVRPNKSEILK